MNKSDCTKIAHILSRHPLLDSTFYEFFELDKRIKEDYELFVGIDTRNENIIQSASDDMEAKYGKDWSLRRDANTEFKDFVRGKI